MKVSKVDDILLFCGAT